METILQFVTSHVDLAHWWFFLLLILAGFNLPISEDLIVLTGAVLAATVAPQNVYKIFIFIFLGCFISDWIAYWIGRSLTPWLKSHKYLSKIINNKRMLKVNQFYDKYGASTLLFGRFIPFGIRNFLFMSAGIVRMNFLKFVIVDGIACLLSNIIWFTLAYSLAESHPTILHQISKVNIIIFVAFLFFIIITLCYKRIKWKKDSKNT